MSGQADIVDLGGTVPEAEYGEPNRVSVDDMLHEIAHQSYAVTAALEQVSEQVAALPDEVLRSTRHVYVTGCGDSWFAGVAARLAFARYAGLPCEPIEALDLGRYAADALPEGSLVLAISNSGKATRTVEAALCATQAGAMTVAITGNTASRLAQACRLTLNQRIERDGYALTMPSNLDGGIDRPSFGLANYLVSFTTLILVAMRLGRLRGRLSDADERGIRADVARAADAIDRTVEGCDAAAERFAHQFVDHDHVTILGAGPAHGMALFYGAKTYELARINGDVQQLEEWAHEQFFITGERSRILFVAPPGRSMSRVVELLDTATQLGATCGVVTSATGLDVASPYELLPVHGEVPEELIGIPYVVPGELLATYVARHRGHGAFEFDSDLQYRLNMVTIQSSRIWSRT